MFQLIRILKIIFVIARYRLDLLIVKPKFYLLRLLLLLLPWRVIPAKYSSGKRLRLALTALGPVFIKFGQQLSTRRDLIPDDIDEELAKLQDQVPPFETKIAIATIERSLKKPLSELFSVFDQQPLAAASVAQVYSAILPTGEQVVVKVIRPKLVKVIQQDVQLLYFLATVIEFIIRDARRFRLKEIVADFEKTLFDELNLQREAANASQLRRNFQDSNLMDVPKVYWSYCTADVMVLERVNGVPIRDIETLKRKKVNLKKLAEHGVETFFTQVFRDSFFHADMHPGNIFIDVEDPENPRYIAVDFGIVGSLSPDDQSYLARNLLAFFNRNYRTVAKLHIDSGWVAMDTQVNELESIIRTVCEPIFEKPLSEISFGLILLQLFRIARRFDMKVQPQLILLQKTLLNIEGLGKQLYPELDLWVTAHPFLELWMRSRVSPWHALRRIHRQMPQLIEQAPILLDQALRDYQYDQRLRRQQRIQLQKKITESSRSWLPKLLGGCILSVGIIVWLEPEWINVKEGMSAILIFAGLSVLALSRNGVDPSH